MLCLLGTHAETDTIELANWLILRDGRTLRRPRFRHRLQRDYNSLAALGYAWTDTVGIGPSLDGRVPYHAPNDDRNRARLGGPLRKGAKSQYHEVAKPGLRTVGAGILASGECCPQPVTDWSVVGHGVGGHPWAKKGTAHPGWAGGEGMGQSNIGKQPYFTPPTFRAADKSSNVTSGKRCPWSAY